MFHDEAVDPATYHKQLDDKSWFYKDQKKRYDKNKKAGKKIEYRIDPDRHKVKKEAMNFTEFLQSDLDFKGGCVVCNITRCVATIGKGKSATVNILRCHSLYFAGNALY